MLEQAIYAIGAAGRSEQDYAQQLLTRLQCAINQRNWALFGECFTENVLLVNLLGQRLSGRAELKVYLQQLLELHQDRVWAYQLLHLQQLDFDTFLINAQQQWRHKEGQHKVGMCSTPLYVVKRQGNQWQICAGNVL